MEVERLMVHATIAVLKSARNIGIDDNGLIRDWGNKLKEDKEDIE